MSERDVIEGTPQPNSLESLTADLEQLGVEPGMVLLVHASLSSLGWTIGGAVTVVLALEAALREYGTLVMPTQSGHLSEPAGWNSPPVPKAWWEQIRRDMPAYDPAMTPSVGMGAIAECFRTQPESVRSKHPNYSFAAWGERAVEICADHQLEFGLGEDSPLARIYALNGWVLLLGCGFDKNTSFHLAEYRGNYGTKQNVERYAPVSVDGHRRWKSFADVDINSDDFEDLGAEFCKHNASLIREGTVGVAKARLFPQRACVDYAQKWLHRNRRA
ncbi:MAG: aminoglycoside N(3)-acetyltransferase [Spirochaetota bacterium]